MTDTPDKIPELEPPETVSISIADLRIIEAADIAADGDAYYLKTMPVIIDRLRCTYAEYWQLTVAEHQMMISYLEKTGGLD